MNQIVYLEEWQRIHGINFKKKLLILKNAAGCLNLNLQTISE